MAIALTAAEMAALASITERADAINGHIAGLKAIAASVPPTLSASIPPAPLERVPLSPAPPIRASLIGEPMQQMPITPPAPKALDLARYQVPPGVEIKPDHGG